MERDRTNKDQFLVLEIISLENMGLLHCSFIGDNDYAATIS